MATKVYQQPELLPGGAKPTPPNSETTFIDNMKLPIHRWFRYSAGFSAQWADRVITERSRTGPIVVLDPFVGSGTTLLAAGSAGTESIGIEAHPFVARVARAKLHSNTDPRAFLLFAQRVRQLANDLDGRLDGYPSLIRRCFDDESLLVLDRLRRSWEELADESPQSELVWLALVAILRPVSHAGTAPWQYVLPAKAKRKPLHPMTAFDQTISMMAVDMELALVRPPASRVLLQTDARSCSGVLDQSVDLVVTSPPYPNNYDYADATRLEMSFMGEVDGWGDLQERVRKHLVRSCSQHMSAREDVLSDLVHLPELSPIASQLAGVCADLAAIRMQKGGKKSYHLMIAAYFGDMAKTWNSLRRVCRTPAEVCFVIGDSAPYGVYVPVIEWMGALASAAGFESWEFEKTRDRNVKWKNRKHQVPLCEGRLWVRG